MTNGTRNSKRDEPAQAPMNDRICVVTGATSGIGRATAIGLAKLGAKVVIVARNPAKATEVVAEIAAIPGAPAAEVVLADLTEMKQVARAAKEIGVRFDRVDVLISNAGGMFDRYHESSEGIEAAYAVNHLAVFLLTLSLHASLRKAPHPRAVVVGSNVQDNIGYVRDYGALVRPRYDWTRVYAQTKLRNVIFARALSERWKDDGITVNSLHPGVVDTGLISGWENPVMRTILGITQKFFMSPEAGARTSIFLASDPSVAGTTGTYFDKSKPHRHNPVADDVAVQTQLWEESIAFLSQAGVAVPTDPIHA
jgi:NAD(P)-dependent dehydrogenase (short-subunit alcohol dehydrogenase family)